MTDLSRHSSLPLSALGGCALLLLAGGCDRQREIEAAPVPEPLPAAHAELPAPAAAASPAAPAMKVVAAEAGEPIERKLTLDSHLLVERDVGVTARRDGIIEKIQADRGQHVTENQALATLEHGDLLLSEKASLLELAKEQSSYDRAVKLTAQGIIPEEEFEQVRLRRDAAEKALERVRYELEKCVVRAPFPGVVSGRFVEKGQVIQVDDRKVLFQVTALSPLLARVYAPEWALFGLRESQRARVRLTAAPPGAAANAGKIEARVRWINDVVDAASATAEMLVEVLGGTGAERLRPGMSVQVELDLSLGGSGASVVSLPREAVGESDPSPGQEMQLRVLSSDGSVQTRSVVLGFVGDHRVEVRRGLSAGEKVILN